MIGAIIGDIVGSVYEFNNTHDYDFPFFDREAKFTDDTVLTIATSDLILKKYDQTTARDYADIYKEFGRHTNSMKSVKIRTGSDYCIFGIREL